MINARSENIRVMKEKLNENSEKYKKRTALKTRKFLNYSNSSIQFDY